MSKSTVNSRMASVEARYGKTTGAAKGSSPTPPAKVKPTRINGKPGVKVTKKF